MPEIASPNSNTTRDGTSEYRHPKQISGRSAINRSVVVVSIPLCSLRWPEKDGASWTDDLPCFGIHPILTSAIPNEILAGLGIERSFRIPGILSRPVRQFQAGDRL